ncbi:MAG TPA: squalene--hopene cyclase, partial [Verrucomicrobiales bacterium]|nr:squalene--hopene cyclase [Verrucomicrobiales bacterium]
MRNFLLSLLLIISACAQDLPRRQDDSVPAQVEQMFERGLRYLATKQTAEGCWDDSQGNEPGVVGLATIAFLAHGEDPNHGPYAK